MSLLKRLSDGFWSYVSPHKSTATNTTPKTVPRRKQTKAKGSRRPSLQDIIRDDTSMDPIDRVDSWRDRSTSTVSKQRGRKRKYPSTPSTSNGRGRPKKAKMVVQDDMAYIDEEEQDQDIIMQYEEDDEDASELSTAMSNIRVDRSPSSPYSKGYEYLDSDIEVDTTQVVSEEEYHRESPPAGRRKLISPTTEHFKRGVDTSELRAHGWGDDHITLMQRLSLRGFEPLLPAYWKFDYSFMPDALFSTTDDAFVSSVRGDQFRAIAAFEKLLEMGGRVRDRLILQGPTGPEQQSCRQVRAFMRWAEADAQLDPRTAIPIMVLENAPADTPATVLQENARKKCAKLAKRWHDALRVTQSIEFAPTSSKSKKSRKSTASTQTQLAYPIPTLYAIIASHTLVALTAYNPADSVVEDASEPQIKSAAFFDMKDSAYDVWNALAIAIIVCHVRNVQARLAEQTGVGVRAGTPGDGSGKGRKRGRSVGSDPDA